MRVALGLLLALVLAAPASALSPAPTIVDFESFEPGTANPASGGASFVGPGECAARVQGEGGHFEPQWLSSAPFCTNRFTISFEVPQAVVEVYAQSFNVVGRRSAGGTNGELLFPIDLLARDAGGVPVGAVQLDVPESTWTPVTLYSNTRTATIATLEVRTSRSAIGIDDVGFSPVADQPDTAITSGPSGTLATGEAQFAFTANQRRATFTCRLDGGAAEPCETGKTYTGLADGPHTFTVLATDRWGTQEPTPATRTWTVARPAPPTDRDRDGVADTGDNCPDNANPSQSDADKDRIGDACEVLPSGTRPIEAGRATRVKLLSGDVFVKLPAGATGSAFTSALRVPFQDDGFVPLKGVATVPMGSTLDTRAGQVGVTAAVNGQRPRSRSQLRREARFRAGIFQIRQDRRKRKQARKRRIPVRAQLVSAKGAEAPCTASGPPKGTRVRSLSMTAKGVFRAVGGAATATPAKGTATFVTTDRCDGTVTEVGRGRVAVIARKTGKKKTVKAGQAYIVRLRLFAARKGRSR